MATKTRTKTKQLNPTDVLVQTVLPGQRSSPGGPLLNFLFRSIPSWMSPNWQSAALWRGFVASVPVATVCRNTAINQLTALDWKIVARDSNKTDELKTKIQYNTKLLDNEGLYDGLDFTGRLEWLGKDILDLPFGMAAEVGRENDDPNGKIVWLRCLDGGTLIPSLNADFPVIQRVPNMPIEPIAFPSYSIVRQYMSPRSDIWFEGWGMAPPEQIYLALELMKRGDKYYAELLTNTPQVGILDLGDTEKDVAQEWMKEAQDLFSGTDPMKIPVLYEHTTKAEWIPFNMNPNELMFDRITSRYVELICAGYGMSPSDIGMGGSSNGGETLSGTIRSERNTKKNINSVLKKKFKSFFDKILPEELEFTWIDFDDDQNVARGRARLANAQADEIFVRNHVFAQNELRAQGLVDGLVTVSVPETLDESKVDWPASGNTTSPGLLGEKVSADNGGRGEVSSVQASLTVDLLKPIKAVVSRSYQPIQKLIETTQGMSPEELKVWKKRVNDTLWWRSKSETEKEEAPVVDTEAIFARFSDIVDGLGEKLTPQPVNVTVHTHPGDPPIISVKPPHITNINNMPEIKQANVNVDVNPTPVTVENTVNVPKSEATVVNVSPTPVTVENTVNVPENPVNITNEINMNESDEVKVERDRNGTIIGLKKV